MRFSSLYAPTLKEVPSYAEEVSHRLLLRGGFIRMSARGVYTYLPLGFRVLKKIENIVREEMNRIGGQEILLPIVQPAELWKMTGRWDDYGPEMMKLKDRSGREFTLGPTHEEIITDLVKTEIKTYKQLPILLYQIYTKYRDELRPRGGLLRAREFIMKDLYSFHDSQESLDRTYDDIYKAYERVCKRLGIKAIAVEAASGAIGGSVSHEFVILAERGETKVLFCENCGYAANEEKAEYRCEYKSSTEEFKGLKKVLTPNVRTVEEVANFLNKDTKQIVKSMVYRGKEGFVIALMRGDLDINLSKLKTSLSDQTLRPATSEEVKELTGAPAGFVSPVGLNSIKVIGDYSVKGMKNFVVGGNEIDTHFINANFERDIRVDLWQDIKVVKEGDKCPKCGAPLKAVRGIEIGHIFKLGTKYSEKLGAYVVKKDGRSIPIIMGCYGFGISRAVAAIVEQKHDENGMVWPITVAPYEIIIVPLGGGKRQKRVAEDIYELLTASGYEVMLDDRNVSAGIKLKDMDLIGIPIKLIVGRNVDNDKVELVIRESGKREEVSISEGYTEVISKISNIINDMKEALNT